MSKINKYNYEAFLLDFAEGQLSAQDTEALFDFLAQHPEYQSDFDVFTQDIKLTSDDVFVFNKKELLNKDEDADAESDLIIAHLEGLASANDSLALTNAMVGNFRLAQEYSIYQKLIFNASDEIGFAKKETLVKPIMVPLRTWIYRMSYSAAAAILLFLFVNLYFDSSQKNIEMVYRPKAIQKDSNVPNKEPFSLNDDVNPMDESEHIAYANDNNPISKSLPISTSLPIDVVDNQTASNFNHDAFEWLELPLSSNVDLGQTTVDLVDLADARTNDFQNQYDDKLSFVDALALESGAVRAIRNLSMNAAKELQKRQQKESEKEFYEFDLGKVHTRIQKPFRKRLRKLRYKKNK